MVKTIKTHASNKNEFKRAQILEREPRTKETAYTREQFRETWDIFKSVPDNLTLRNQNRL